jgi:GDP-L-fucose synthase
MSKILITGASGFLGQCLSAALRADGVDPVALNSKNCDLRNPDSLRQFDAIEFDRIFHLAAWTQAGDFCLHHPGEQWIINQQINTNVLAWWQERQPQAKLVFMGTSCAYDPQLPLVEENYLNGRPIDSLFTYAMSKRMLYAGALALNRQFGLNYLCLVPSTLYGANYHTDGRQMHFIFDLIRKIIKGKYLNTPVELWGDGYQSRELVLVDDFVKIMLELDQTQANELINIGAGEEYTIRHFASLICQRVGYDFNDIAFDTSKYVGAKSKCLSTEKLQRLLPGYQLTPLEEGLPRTVDFFLDNKETILAL